MPRACAHNTGCAGNTNAHAGNTNAHAQCTEIYILKRDQRTYIHTDAKRDAKQD